MILAEEKNSKDCNSYTRAKKNFTMPKKVARKSGKRAAKRASKIQPRTAAERKKSRGMIRIKKYGAYKWVSKAKHDLAVKNYKKNVPLQNWMKAKKMAEKELGRTLVGKHIKKGSKGYTTATKYYDELQAESK